MSHRVAQKLQLQHYNVVAVHAAVVTATKKNCAVVTAGKKDVQRPAQDDLVAHCIWELHCRQGQGQAESKTPQTLNEPIAAIQNMRLLQRHGCAMRGKAVVTAEPQSFFLGGGEPCHKGGSHRYLHARAPSRNATHFIQII